MPTDHNMTDGEDQVTYGLAELSERSGVAARTIRFYTTEGLLAAPDKAGRDAVYHAQHLVTLELIRELQGHGFGLASIKEHLNRIPADSSPTTIAMHSTMLAPWLADRPETITRAELDARTARPLTDEDIAVLHSLGLLKRLDDDDGTQRYEVATALLSLAVELIDIGITPDAAKELAHTIDEAGTRLTAELGDLYTRLVRPVLADKDYSDDDVERFVALFKPVSIAAVARSYEQALSDLRVRESEAAQGRRDARNNTTPDSTQGA